MNKKIRSIKVDLDLHFQIQSIQGSRLRGDAQVQYSCLEMADMEVPMRTLNRHIPMALWLVSCIFREDLTRHSQLLCTCHTRAAFSIAEFI